MPKDAENYPEPAKVGPPNMTKTNQVIKPATKAIGSTFPHPHDKTRLSKYDYYTALFSGDHFEAFNMQTKADNEFSKAWNKLRYTVVNFSGLVSKVVADMLFSEPVQISVPDGDQEFVENLWRENKMNVQLYESALSNSYLGDALFKLRIGPREANSDKATTIIEDITPKIYFPTIDDFNVRATPKKETLAWVFEVSGTKYLRLEIHKDGELINQVWKMKGEKLVSRQPLSLIGDDIQENEETKVEFSLLEHVPNWKTGDRFFGISDYYDLDSLFYAINNRMSKIDNILDKHSDPILTVPTGILNEKGEVKKSELGVIEVQEGESGRPEYVVWDASLENAFRQIEKLVEFMYMIGEVSPDVLGMGKGQAESGRALKFKLLRTIAKVARKRLYYDHAIKQIMYKAQVLSKEWGVEVGGKRLEGDPVMPELEWADGMPTDEVELIDNNIKLVDAGLKSKKAAIMSVHGVDEDSAESMIKESQEESKEAIKMSPLADFKLNNNNNDRPTDDQTGDDNDK